MYRQSIVDTSGRAFLQRFRNGLETLDEEINKVETITADLDHPNLPRGYFREQSIFLNNLKFHLNETEKLHKQVSTSLPSLECIENRLQNLRDRLRQFEENPKILARGYQPFGPKLNDSSEIDDSTSTDEGEIVDNEEPTEVIVRSEITNSGKKSNKPFRKTLNNINNNSQEKMILTSDSIDNDCSTLNDIPHHQTTEEHFKQTILSSVKKNKQNRSPPIKQQSAKKFNSKLSKTSKVDAIKMDNPMVARAFSIYNRWVKDDSDQSFENLNQPMESDLHKNGYRNHETRYESSSSNILSTIKKINEPASLKKNKIMTKADGDNDLINDEPGQKLATTAGVTPKASLRKNRIVAKQPQSKFLANKNFVIQDEYETVEFTPGMTSKIRKSEDSKR